MYDDNATGPCDEEMLEAEAYIPRALSYLHHLTERVAVVYDDNATGPCDEKMLEAEAY